jgi:hypothetical protein
MVPPPVLRITFFRAELRAFAATFFVSLQAFF